MAGVTVRELTKLGQEIGLERKALQKFIVEQQAEERAKRAAERECRAAEQDAAKYKGEREERILAQKLELERQKYLYALDLERVRLETAKLSHRSEVETTKEEAVAAERRCHTVKVPAFNNQQLTTVARYLELFECVMQQNGYPEEMWALHLRAGVIGSQLEEIVQVTATYEEMKAEILVAHGETPEKIWAELANDWQGEESFG